MGYSNLTPNPLLKRKAKSFIQPRIHGFTAFSEKEITHIHAIPIGGAPILMTSID